MLSPINVRINSTFSSNEHSEPKQRARLNPEVRKLEQQIRQGFEDFEYERGMAEDFNREAGGEGWIPDVSDDKLSKLTRQRQTYTEGWGERRKRNQV